MEDRIYLVGFMGAGKTTVGRLVAKRLGWNFVDLDAEIERREGRSVAEIFRDPGESRFRELESQCLRLLSEASHSVFALGGGTYLDPSNREYVDAHGISVYLETGLSAIRNRIQVDPLRPLFSGSKDLEELFRRRGPSYKMAQVTVETDDLDPDQVADRVIQTIRSS